MATHSLRYTWNSPWRPKEKMESRTQDFSIKQRWQGREREREGRNTLTSLGGHLHKGNNFKAIAWSMAGTFFFFCSPSSFLPLGLFDFPSPSLPLCFVCFLPSPLAHTHTHNEQISGQCREKSSSGGLNRWIGYFFFFFALWCFACSLASDNLMGRQWKQWPIRELESECNTHTDSKWVNEWEQQQLLSLPSTSDYPPEIILFSLSFFSSSYKPHVR